MRNSPLHFVRRHGLDRVLIPASTDTYCPVIAAAWGRETQIIDLEWNGGTLSLTATSASALASLRKLTYDPWFHALRVGDIRTQKDGSELFTVEGGLSIDS